MKALLSDWAANLSEENQPTFMLLSGIPLELVNSIWGFVGCESFGHAGYIVQGFVQTPVRLKTPGWLETLDPG